MSAPDERHGHSSGEEKLFDDIREFLTEQSADRIYEDLSEAYAFASQFVDRELRDIDEFGRMLRALEKLVDDIFGATEDPAKRAKMAEILYIYGLAHYSLMQQVFGSSSDAKSDDDDDDDETSRPLVIYDVWFPSDIAIERAQDGLYLHISDGRIDISLYLGESTHERGALVDLVDHWEYATANTGPIDREADLTDSVPLLTIELDYSGSELVDAHDHVDILFFDDEGEPVVRMHARATDLRAIVDELQSSERGGSL